MPTIKFCIERELPVPAAKVWAFLGEGFGSWESWASAFESCSLDRALGQGCIRTYKLKGLPNTVVQEVLAYDPATFVLEYVVLSGAHEFMKRIANRWQLVPMGETRCKVICDADFTVAWYMTLLYYPVKWKLVTKLNEFQDDIEAESKKTLVTATEANYFVNSSRDGK
jgi:hypothetical protein